MTERDLQQDIFLQKNCLDDEWLEQARKYYYYAAAAVEAAAAKDRLKFQCDTMEAKVESEIRKNPERFGVDKITDSSVKAAMLSDDRIQDARKDLLNADKEMKLLQVAERTIGDMKKSLEKLTDLFLSNYWAEPRPPKQIVEHVVETGSEAQRSALGTSTRLQRRNLSERLDNGNS